MAVPWWRDSDDKRVVPWYFDNNTVICYLSYYGTEMCVPCYSVKLQGMPKNYPGISLQWYCIQKSVVVVLLFLSNLDTGI